MLGILAHRVMVHTQAVKVLPALRANCVIHGRKDPSARLNTDGQTLGAYLLSDGLHGPDTLPQEPVKPGEVPIQHAGKDDTGHPEPTVRMRQNDQESTKEPKARSGEQGTEGFQPNPPFRRRLHMLHSKNLFDGRFLEDDVPSPTAPEPLNYSYPPNSSF